MCQPGKREVVRDHGTEDTTWSVVIATKHPGVWGAGQCEAHAVMPESGCHNERRPARAVGPDSTDAAQDPIKDGLTHSLREALCQLFLQFFETLVVPITIEQVARSPRDIQIAIIPFVFGPFEVG